MTVEPKKRAQRLTFFKDAGVAIAVLMHEPDPDPDSISGPENEKLETEAGECVS